MPADLWTPAWRGLVTNDTFGPLRAIAAGRARRGSLAAGGRWSTVRRLLAPAGETERALARAETLLRRYGVVGARAARPEELPGAGAAVWPAWRALEEAGRARRGFWVEGLGGGQFALPGAVDALRGELPSGPVVLAACDPANPYGALLDAGRPGYRRAAGARVVLVDGRLAAFVERGGRALTLAAEDREAALGALAAVPGPRVERVNGGSPFAEALAGLFRSTGWRMTPRGRETR